MIILSGSFPHDNCMEKYTLVIAQRLRPVDQQMKRMIK
jgi:hypothetical protein